MAMAPARVRSSSAHEVEAEAIVRLIDAEELAKRGGAPPRVGLAHSVLDAHSGGGVGGGAQHKGAVGHD